MKKISMILCAIALVFVLTGCTSFGQGYNWEGHNSVFDLF